MKVRKGSVCLSLNCRGCMTLNKKNNIVRVKKLKKILASGQHCSISFINFINNSPSTRPCGTPVSILLEDELQSFMLTNCERYSKYHWKRLSTVHELHSTLTFFNSIVLLMRSNSLENSTYTPIISFLSSKDLKISSFCTKSAVSDDLCFLKPCWKSDSIECFSR